MPDYTFTGHNAALTEKARKLRREMTRQERHLWYDFLSTYPIKFYRQRVIGRYIADFYCSKAHLVVELDGSQHYMPEGALSDRVRTERMEEYGLTVLRFSNADVDRHFEGVCTVIDHKVNELMGRNEGEE